MGGFIRLALDPENQEPTTKAAAQNQVPPHLYRRIRKNLLAER